ncbi:long-chain fatty acid-CoA ligase [Microbotryomycetes sp. JL221]|nr:long-chain fatty acid-CoA ligase [Microbotryomycetes sp. JL221]
MAKSVLPTKNGSVEVGPETKGQGRVRRFVNTADKLVERPSEGINVIADILKQSSVKYADQRAVGWRDLVKMHTEKKDVQKKVDGKEVTETKTWQYYELTDYKYMTYKQLYESVKQAGSALVETGHSKDTIFNIYSQTSKNWQIMANACAMQSITFATAYDSLGEDGLQHSLAEPDVYGLFTNANLIGTISNVIDKTPSVKVLVYDGKQEDVKAGALDKIKGAGVKVLHIDEFLQLGKDNPREPNHPQPDDVACLMYTSGSTGAPKGVQITNRNVIAAIAGAELLLGELIFPGARYIAFLPLAHIFEFAVEMTLLYCGIPMGYAGVKTLTDNSVRNCVGDMRAFKPTLMCGVPAVWEQIRKGILAKVRAGGKEKIFNWAFSTKSSMGNRGLIAKLLDTVVFSKVKEATGGSLKYAVNGGAAISKDTQSFLQTSLVEKFLAGYGLTETCALAFILPPTMLQTGVVGVPSPAVEAKLVDYPEANYFSTNNPPQGEVWIRGATVTKGYYKRPDETKEAYTDDGWFKTGDIGEWRPDGTLAIIDRKKNLVKLSGGEYIALERLESIYKSCALVANICLIADPDATKPMAIIFPHEQNLKSFVAEKGISGVSSDSDLEALCSNDDVRKSILAECNAVGKRAGLKPLETLQTCILDPTEWTPQSGMLTAAQKLQRKTIQGKFADKIKAIYP